LIGWLIDFSNHLLQRILQTDEDEIVRKKVVTLSIIDRDKIVEPVDFFFSHSLQIQKHVPSDK
jgi:hypothetical protein